MSEWSEFELNGWTFKAMMPDHENETQQWTVRIVSPSGEQSALYVPMDYAPIFGPDASDVAALNVAVEQFIQDRGIE